MKAGLFESSPSLITPSLHLADPTNAAICTLKQLAPNLQPNDNVLLMHHCRATNKSVDFMETVIENLPGHDIHAAMVTAPYNGLEGKFYGRVRESLEAMNVHYAKNIWAFLPDHALRKLEACADPNDYEVRFYPPNSTKPSDYGVNLMLEYQSVIRELAKVNSQDVMVTLYKEIMKAAAPMNGFTIKQFEHVAKKVQDTKDQSVVDAFLKQRANYLEANPITGEILKKAIAQLTKALEEKFPFIVDEKLDNSAFASIKAAIMASNEKKGKTVTKWLDELQAVELSELPVYKSDEEWKERQVKMSDIEWKVPRAITKVIESLYAPFEMLALDGKASFLTIQGLSSDVTRFFDNYVVVQIHDLESDDVGALQGFKSLPGSQGRHVTAVQLSTGVEPGKTIDPVALDKENNFTEFVARYGAAQGQEQLYLFEDSEGWNQKPVKGTIEHLRF